ncbi:histidine phosphatase family protein [Candidatus Kaiserbacteria bacterium]|nr:histidine phosphatase family protein [Candidatus Kaiserbacteria bacterium]
MEIYFVRHGQTDGNLSRRHQIDTTELTFTGREQAVAAAKKIKALEPTHIITSSLVRAIETAREIGNECSMVPEVSGHFVEIIRPDSLVGVHHFSFTSLWFYVQWYFGRDTAKTLGGESYRDLRNRIERAKSALAELPQDARVVVVSHGVFINFFLIHMCDGRWMSPLRALRAFRSILRMPNTKITKISYDPTVSDNVCAWAVDR